MKRDITSTLKNCVLIRFYIVPERKIIYFIYFNNLNRKWQNDNLSHENLMIFMRNLLYISFLTSNQLFINKHNDVKLIFNRLNAYFSFLNILDLMRIETFFQILFIS